MGLFSILVIHYVVRALPCARRLRSGLFAAYRVRTEVSAIGIGIGLFYPIWDSDAIWPLTRAARWHIEKPRPACRKNAFLHTPFFAARCRSSRSSQDLFFGSGSQICD